MFLEGIVPLQMYPQDSIYQTDILQGLYYQHLHHRNIQQHIIL